MGKENDESIPGSGNFSVLIKKSIIHKYIGLREILGNRKLLKTCIRNMFVDNWYIAWNSLLLFILSYFVFYFCFLQLTRLGLRGVQLQDKPYLVGIDDLSPNAFVFATTGEDAPDYVITLDNTYFKWGDFRLNKLSLNSYVVRINNLVRLGEQHDTDLGMPETISINGQSCLSRGSFVLYE